ncbi:NADH dehydrogenase [ubiquinone] 1 beta subcomplex subunit 11, mitochondrial-like [Watersipora subatra]|uniref:NADH dehydrogenase [ubiquinone] 1 beta subcomplex subunit 11, mitochondrial-like n=1 Tax=Watersipora subatra TaxID=2589382 RepID=UPI00355C8432
MAGIGPTRFYRLSPLLTRICCKSSKVRGFRLYSSGQLQNSSSLNLTDPTKHPDYEKEIKRFEDISDKDENYHWHGYDPFNREEDTLWHHHTMFTFVSLCFVGGAFIFAYQPDPKLASWRQREAYLELARREQHGLPLIDPNLVPPEKMLAHLPQDEELGDTEIIV